MDYNPLVTIAIVTWNRKEEVLRAISSCYYQTYKNTEVVIIDNASKDGTYESIKSNYPGVKLIRTHRNLGCPPARNIAFANSDGEIIFSLDDDGWLDERCIEKVVQSFMENDRLAVIACKIINPNINENCILGDKKRYTSLFTGCAFAIRKSILNEVGYFPDYFRQAEESYLALKILEKSYHILYNPECIMYHNVSQKGRENHKIIYEGFKNDLENIRRLLPLRYAIPIIGYKFFSHLKSYLIEGYLTKFPFDAFKSVINIMRRFDDEMISFKTYKLFRKMR